MSLNCTFSWTTKLNSVIFHRSVWHNAHYHNCTNGMEVLNKKATRAIDKKYLWMNSPPEPQVQIQNIFLTWQKCSSWCLLPKFIRMFSPAEQHGYQSKNRNILKRYIFSHRPIHHLMCQDSGERSRALGPSCLKNHQTAKLSSMRRVKLSNTITNYCWH